MGDCENEPNNAGEAVNQGRNKRKRKSGKKLSPEEPVSLGKFGLPNSFGNKRNTLDSPNSGDQDRMASMEVEEPPSLDEIPVHGQPLPGMGSMTRTHIRFSPEGIPITQKTILEGSPQTPRSNSSAFSALPSWVRSSEASDTGQHSTTVSNQQSSHANPSQNSQDEDEDTAKAWKRTEKLVGKYWKRRYYLFSKFDDGIQMDDVAWYSVTPEKIAKENAQRCGSDVVVDAMACVGGDTIQLAMTSNLVISIEIDPDRSLMAKNNARVYGVEHKIEFINGDFLQIAKGLKADVVYLSPPWGGPAYFKKGEAFDLEYLTIPIDELMDASMEVAPNVAMYLPVNTNRRQLLEIAVKYDLPIRFRVATITKRMMREVLLVYMGPKFMNIRQKQKGLPPQDCDDVPGPKQSANHEIHDQ
eukprot:Clim_evm60s152 gene=Clim_evmTU60s152